MHHLDVDSRALVVGDVLSVWLVTISQSVPAAYLPLAGYVMAVLMPPLADVPVADAAKHINAMHACNAAGACRWRSVVSQLILVEAFEVARAVRLVDHNPAVGIEPPWDDEE